MIIICSIIYKKIFKSNKKEMLKNGNIKSENLMRFFEKNEKYYKVFLY